MVRFFFKSLGKGVLWILLSALFGLIQMWIVFFDSFLDTATTLKIEDIISQGFLIYFCSGITVSFMIDYFLSSEINYLRNFEKIFYLLYPILILLFVIIVGTKFQVSTEGSINIDNAKTLQTIIILMTIIYSLVIKTKDYFNFNDAS